MLACSQETFFHGDTTMQPQQTKKSRQYNRKDQYNGLINNPNVIISANNFRDKEEQVWPPDVEDAFTEGNNTFTKLQYMCMCILNSSYCQLLKQFPSWEEEKS